MSWGYACWCTQYVIDKRSTQAYSAYVCLGGRGGGGEGRGEGRGELYCENQDKLSRY